MKKKKNRLAERVLEASPETVKAMIDLNLAQLPHKDANEWSEHLIAYLTLCNGGAATAILALLGATETWRETMPIYWALAFFIVGLILVGCLWIAQGFRMEEYNEHLLAAVYEFGAANLDAARTHLAAMAREDVISRPGFMAARISFYLFGAGCLSACAAAFLTL